MILKNFDVT